MLQNGWVFDMLLRMVKFYKKEKKICKLIIELAQDRKSMFTVLNYMEVGTKNVQIGQFWGILGRFKSKLNMTKIAEIAVDNFLTYKWYLSIFHWFDMLKYHLNRSSTQNYMVINAKMDQIGQFRRIFGCVSWFGLQTA